MKALHDFVDSVTEQRRSQQREKYGSQDVILDFPRERRVDPDLDRQLMATLLVGDIAERLYHARCLHLGGNFLHWHELTPCQQRAFRLEIEDLITGDKGA